jgi:nitronate monooxygenase
MHSEIENFMWKNNPIAQHLGIQYPIIQAPMAGGASSPELVAAVCNAGGLGSIGAGYLSPAQLSEQIDAVRCLTAAPFAVNLFVPESADLAANADKIANMQTLLKPYHQALGLENTPSPHTGLPNFAAQMAVILEKQVPIFSFTFGQLSPEWIDQLHRADITVIGTATTVAEALALEISGVDMIVAQGYEAGGHRGTFLESVSKSSIGSFALIPQMVDKVKIPVIAAGGIMDSRGIIAALALGAKAVQMGTAFLSCPESGISAAYKQAVPRSRDQDTCLTRAFSGRWARGIENQLIRDLADAEIPDYPLQNSLTRELRQAAAQQSKPEFLSLWAGQAASLTSTAPAAQLIAEWVHGVESGLSLLK